MPVTLVVSKTLGGAAVSDSVPGGSSGYDFGLSETGDASPDAKLYYLKLQFATNFIFDLAVNVQAFSGTYGGDYSASADLSKLISHGNSGYGLQCDFDFDAATPFTTFEQFETGNGVSFSDRILIPVESFLYDNASVEVAASSPTAGSLGIAGNTALGDNAKMRFRYVTPAGEPATGTRQFDIYFSYNFTT